MKISIGTLKDSGEELVTFLEPRVGVKPALSGDSMEIDQEAAKKGLKPRHVKTYIKRFLYMKGVRRKYRVFVSGAELTIQEIELGEKGEEEEGKEEAEAAPAPEKKEEPEEAPKEEKPKTAKKPRAKKKAQQKETSE